MKEYFRRQEYFIKRIWFEHKQCRYHGSGVMLWNPDEGFHIAARVKREGIIPDREEIKAISFSPAVQIRMRLSNDVRAIVPQARIDDLQLLLGGDFSLNVDRVIFSQPLRKELSNSSWFGSGLYETKTNLLLPDNVTHETKIGDGEPAKGFSRTGLRFVDDSGFRVIGQLDDKKYLTLNWTLPKSAWTKEQSRYFAQGLQEAISIVAGEAIKLRYQELYRNKRLYTEMRIGRKPSSFGIILRPIDYEILDRNTIIQLAKFLTLDRQRGEICRKMLHQIAEASHQQTDQACELLLSTILEAALRTLYNCPFNEGKAKRENKFDIEYSLKKFREDYLSDAAENGRRWKKVITKVIEIRKRLRHRNAHPDWLTEQEGLYAASNIEQAINDMIFLSRFYGYMILALAGFDNLQPSFPKPYAEWNPMFKVERIIEAP